MQTVIRTSQGLLFMLVIAVAGFEWGASTQDAGESTQPLSQLTSE